MLRFTQEGKGSMIGHLFAVFCLCCGSVALLVGICGMLAERVM